MLAAERIGVPDVHVALLPRRPRRARATTSTAAGAAARGVRLRGAAPRPLARAVPDARAARAREPGVRRSTPARAASARPRRRRGRCRTGGTARRARWSTSPSAAPRRATGSSRTSTAAAVDALADAPVRVLLTVGTEVDPADLGAVPANVHVEPWVPQGAVMAHASAMVGHGGSGSTLAAMAAGMPLAVVPLFADQPENADRVADARRRAAPRRRHRPRRRPSRPARGPLLPRRRPRRRRRDRRAAAGRPRRRSLRATSPRRRPPPRRLDKGTVPLGSIGYGQHVRSVLLAVAVLGLSAAPAAADIQLIDPANGASKTS